MAKTKKKLTDEEIASINAEKRKKREAYIAKLSPSAKELFLAREKSDAELKAVLKADRERQKEARKIEREKRNEIRAKEVKVAFVLYRYFEKALKTGSPDVSKILQAVGASIVPHEGYTKEQADADKNAFNNFMAFSDMKK